MIKFTFRNKYAIKEKSSSVNDNLYFFETVLVFKEFVILNSFDRRPIDKTEMILRN